jgi:plastocyanin
MGGRDHTEMPSVAPARAALALAVAVLAGCGGAAREPSPGGTLRLTLDEYRIVPQDPVVAAGRVRVIARNAGRVPHNVELERDGEPVGHTHIAAPGETVATTLRLRPGTYRMSCEVAGHDALGPWGTLRGVARRSAGADGESGAVPGAG